MERNIPLCALRARARRPCRAPGCKAAGAVSSIVLWLLAAASSLHGEVAGPPLTLWYDRPASAWIEALPVGNGRAGGMVFAGTVQERIQFNEATLWNGRPHDYTHPGASTVLPSCARCYSRGSNAPLTRWPRRPS